MDIEKYKLIYDRIYDGREQYNFDEKLKNCLVDVYAEKIEGKILDAGCGEGIHLKRLLEKEIDVYGIELSTVCCEKHLVDTPHRNIDIVSFSKEGHTFDGLICMDVLEHISYEDIDEVLQSLVQLSPSVLLGIANHSDVINGIELHLIREDSQWWLQKLSKYFRHSFLIRNFTFNTEDNIFFLIECDNYDFCAVWATQGRNNSKFERSFYKTGNLLYSLQDKIQNNETEMGGLQRNLVHCQNILDETKGELIKMEQELSETREELIHVKNNSTLVELKLNRIMNVLPIKIFIRLRRLYKKYF